MAKKKKNKGDKGDKGHTERSADRSEGATAAGAAAATSNAPVTGDKKLDAAFAAGNYAAVRHLASPTPEAQKLVALTKIDMGQAVVGLIALIVVLIVAISTLH